MKLIIGLGNPGKTYEKTRHNIGFMVVEALLKELSGAVEFALSKKFNAEVAEVRAENERIIMVKPMTFMNASGEAVQLIMHFYKLTTRDLIVIHDDKDLKLGGIKIQTDRGDAGHNGVKSIIEMIGTKDFTRVRIGIASENKKKMRDTSEFVLGKFGLTERKKLKETITNVVTKIKEMIS
jgi:PTH1 family peptidyl-tRNA hydrolase